MRWFERAAAHGHVGAQHNIGVMFLNGTGVPRNIAKAYAWFVIAASTGDSAAETTRAKVQPSMTKAQIEEAGRLTEKLRAQIARPAKRQD